MINGSVVQPNILDPTVGPSDDKKLPPSVATEISPPHHTNTHPAPCFSRISPHPQQQAIPSDDEDGKSDTDRRRNSPGKFQGRLAEAQAESSIAPQIGPAAARRPQQGKKKGEETKEAASRQSLSGGGSGWTPRADRLLSDLVRTCVFDFEEVAARLCSDAWIGLGAFVTTAEDCRVRFAFLDGEDEGRGDHEGVAAVAAASGNGEAKLGRDDNEGGVGGGEGGEAPDVGCSRRTAGGLVLREDNRRGSRLDRCEDIGGPLPSTTGIVIDLFPCFPHL